MKINELKPNSKVINLAATISFLKEPGTTTTEVPYQEGILEDVTGQVQMTLWGEYVGSFKEGDKILMSSGWCKQFEGINEVSNGKFGKIKKVPLEPVKEGA